MAIHFWGTRPASAADSMRLHGFTPAEAARLVALKARCERGEVDELTDEARRALFVRWLVEHGRLTDWPANGAEHDASR